MKIDPNLVLLGLQEAPKIINALKDLFVAQHPADPPPTSEEVIATFHAVFTSSALKDRNWLEAHPVVPPPPA